MPDQIWDVTTRLDAVTVFRESVLLFEPAKGEEIFLCCSRGCEHGPGINRDGKGPPWMARLDRPWEGTTDPDEQRLRTCFIDQRSKQTRLNDVKDKLKQARRQNLQRQVEKWDRILNGIRRSVPKLDAYPVHEDVFTQKYRNYEIIGEQGCGDLTMNLWNVGYMNSRLSGGPRLIYLQSEPITERRYTCLVKWKDRPDKPYTIETVRFNPFEFAINPASPDVVLAFRKDVGGRILEYGAADRIEFAVYGQQVIANGRRVPLKQNVLEFSDLRHVFLLPNLNPERIMYDGDPGIPRFIYGREQYDPVWFGEAQLLNDRNLRRAALLGPIELSRLHLGMGVSMAHVRAAMEGQYPKADRGVYSAADRYEEETTHLRPLRQGEWRFVPEDSNLVEIYLKPNTFAYTMIGLNRAGEILCLACNGAPGQLGFRRRWRPYGNTVKRAAERLLGLGARNALLIDEGADVFQKARLPQKASGLSQPMPLMRQQVRAVFIFARKRPAQEGVTGEQLSESV